MAAPGPSRPGDSAASGRWRGARGGWGGSTAPGLAGWLVTEAGLQDRIARGRGAAVTSVAGLGIELAGLLVFAAWALGGIVAVAVLVLAVVPVAAAGPRRTGVS